MAACSAFNCSNKIGQNLQGITFHRFPLNKSEQLSKWLKAMRKDKWQPTQSDVICSVHFDDDQFVENNGYRFLTSNAIPTKFEVLPPPKSLFPTNWPPKFLSLRDVENGNRNGYIVEARIPLSLKEEFIEWLKEHTKLSQVTYDLLRNYPTNAKNLSFKAEYVCHQSSRAQQRSNDKPCPAKLLIRIRTDPKFRFNKPVSDDQLSYPCTVVLYHIHNHSPGSNINEIYTFSSEEVSSFVKQKFIEMFKGGYSLADALEMHKKDLFEEYPDEYDEIVQDPYKCPNEEWLYHFYINFMDAFGEWDREKILTILKDEVEEVNSFKGQATMSIIDDQTIVAVSTALMQRAHSLKSSGEIVFIDSSGLLDRCNCYVYVLMAYSCTEGLPLGLIITTSNTENILTEAFKLLADILPPKAFGQYGREGPEVFLTEYDEALQNSLKAVYPNSAVLISSYNLSQSLWYWLWNPENNITDVDRCLLFTLTYRIMKTKNEGEFNAQYQAILANETVKKYENFRTYFEEIRSISDRWAVCFKNEILDKNKEISAIEMASHVMKDKIFLTKAYNILQLWKYLTETMETYYRQKVIHCINNTLENFILSSFNSQMRDASNFTINIISSGQCEVTNRKSGKSYYVDRRIFVCSCDLGKNGGRCKHLYAVCATKLIDFTTSVPDDNVIKRELFWIGTDTMKRGNLGSRIDTDSESETTETPAQPKTPNQSSVQTPIVKKHEAKRILDRIVRSIMEKYDAEPTEFYQAIVTAAVNYQSLNHARDVITALKNFGKPSTYMRK